MLRWNHPDWGLISPEEFLPLVEESDIIIEIGHWVLRKVCQNYRQWLDTGLPAIKVAVNYSGIQFIEKNPVKTISDIMMEYRLDPHFLIIEITESVLVRDSQKIASDLLGLQEMGIQIALDNFGAGFSSLYLHKFKIDLIKLDRSFVQNLLVDETCTIITDNILNLARTLKIKPVAVGIETGAQLAILHKLDCYGGQGHLFSAALPPAEFIRIIAKKRCQPRQDSSNVRINYHGQRGRYFRIEFPLLLKGRMTVLSIRGQKVETGMANVAIKEIGPGGLRVITNIKFPVDREVILQFITELLGKEVMVYGAIVSGEEMEEDLYEYDIEFTITENERTKLIGLLNQVQIRMRKDLSFADGNFISCSPGLYFRAEQAIN